MVDRRTFLVVAGAASFGVASSACGQSGNVKRIGVLIPGVGNGPPADFVERLRKRGWRLGENLVIEERYARGNSEQLIPLAAELVQLKPDLILVLGMPAARAMKRATTTIPVVFFVSNDPVRNGLVASLARPGGNMTGVAWGVPEDKVLEVFKEVIPGLSRVMIMTGQPSNAFLDTARALKVDVAGFEVLAPSDIDVFFESLRNWRADGVILPDMALLMGRMDGIAKRLLDAGIPAASGWSGGASIGGILLAYGPTHRSIDVVAKVDAILRGARPADMPVEMPTSFRLTINRDTAKTLGVTIPIEVLTRASVVPPP